MWSPVMLSSGMFQPTRPREARPNFLIWLTKFFSVSTHAPTGGATYPNGGPHRKGEFQPTRPREARRALVLVLLVSPRVFQPTRPREARLDLLLSGHTTGHVSTHAPTGGATFGINGIWATAKFQPTRPREARRCSIMVRAFQGCFNPRAHGRRDLYNRGSPTRQPGFNPRAHGRRDITHPRKYNQ